MYLYRLVILVVGISVLFPLMSQAQIVQEGIPYSWKLAKEDSEVQWDKMLFIKDWGKEKIAKEDAQKEALNRFAAPIFLPAQWKESGQWTSSVAENRWIWRVEIRVKDAKGLYVVLNDYAMPKEAQLFAFDSQQKSLLGAYTESNNRSHQKLMIGEIKGESLILELQLPAHLPKKLPFEIEKLYVVYRNSISTNDDYPFQTYDGFGDAASCHLNINCPQGQAWQDEKRGVVRMVRVFEEGLGWCTGTLLNNTAEDERQLLLSGYHCYSGATPQLELWTFYFNYEFNSCTNESLEPVAQAIQGCSFLSGWEDSDFLLLDLSTPIPFHFLPYFNGWTRSIAVPSQMAGIHHPRGDVKKISTTQNNISVFTASIQWNNDVLTPPRHHFQVLLEEGSIEDGSSGSAMFNEEGLICGQLHGGNASCTMGNATYYGRLSQSWTGGGTASSRLSDWLDPLQTGQESQGALDSKIELSGSIHMPNGLAVRDVWVYYTASNFSDSTQTDSVGYFEFSTLPKNTIGVLDFSKNTHPTNGLSIEDFLLMRDFFIREITFTEEQQVAGDADNNGNQNVNDFIVMRDIFLRRINSFEGGSWEVLNSPISLPVTQDTSLQLTIVKRGDVNFTADPTR